MSYLPKPDRQRYPYESNVSLEKRDRFLYNFINSSVRSIADVVLRVGVS